MKRNICTSGLLLVGVLAAMLSAHADNATPAAQPNTGTNVAPPTNEAAIPIPTGKQPRLEVPEVAFNFGYVPQGASISHTFWLRNVGEDTLRITDVRPG